MLATDGGRLVVQDAADREAEKFIDRAHPFAVARCEIIIHRHHMDAATRERVEINRQRADERLAFARGHFRNVAGVERITADELHIERHHLPAQRMFAHDDVRAAQAAAGVFDDGERLRQNLIQLGREFRLVLDFGKLPLPRRRLGAQLVVGQRLQSGLDFIDPRDHRADFFHFAFVPGRENGS